MGLTRVRSIVGIGEAKRSGGYEGPPRCRKSRDLIAVVTDPLRVRQLPASAARILYDPPLPRDCVILFLVPRIIGMVRRIKILFILAYFLNVNLRM